MVRTAPWTGPAAWGLWVVSVLGLASLPWLDHLLRQAGRPDLALLTPDSGAFVLGVVSAATVGAVVATRRPRHPVGWLLLVLGASVATSGATTGYANYGLLARPGSLPAASYVAVYPASMSIFFWAACLGFVLLLTPTGSLPSPRWRTWGIAAVVAPAIGIMAALVSPLDEPYRSVVNPMALPGLAGPLGILGLVAFIATGLQIPVASWSVVVRFLRARGGERQQLGWLVFAAAFVAAAVVLIGGLLLVGITDPVVLGWASGTCVAILPIAIGASILRYRLYDIDRLVNRTLVYGVLTAVLGGAYALVVTLAGTLLHGSAVVTAAATLAIAGLFRPLRGRTQAFIDRRFYRRKYDAARIVEEFSGRLKDEVDLERMRVDLMAVVRETMEPGRVSLWLKQP